MPAFLICSFAQQSESIIAKRIELLSPAKNIEIGIAAINHGADAVYIGYKQFGARTAAGNSLINKFYLMGVDAIIIQDMAILEMNLPPIGLHASTQAHNETIEKVEFLEQVGLSRVVLARELSIGDIAQISAKSNIELDVFIHGSLCVSYSGQYYLSQALTSRSANRDRMFPALQINL